VFSLLFYSSAPITTGFALDSPSTSNEDTTTTTTPTMPVTANPTIPPLATELSYTLINTIGSVSSISMDADNAGAVVALTVVLGTTLNVGDIVRFQYYKSQDVTPDSIVTGMPYSQNAEWVDYANYFIQDYQPVITGGNTFTGVFWVNITPPRNITAADFWGFQMYLVSGSTPAPTAQPATISPIKPNLPGPIYAYETCRPGTAMLTFDDGPGVTGSATSKVLDALARAGVNATFFLAPGDYDATLLSSKANLVQRMYAEGHLIGCHSWNHPDFTNPRLTNDVIKSVHLDPCQAWVQSILPGYVVTHWRPPFGRITESQAEFVASQGYVQGFWNVDFQDFNFPGNYSLHVSDATNYFQKYEATFGEEIPSPVILMHDESEYNAVDPQTGEHFVEWIVNFLSAKGYSFIRGDECWNTCPEYVNGGFCQDPHYVHADWCTHFTAYQGNPICGN